MLPNTYTPAWFDTFLHSYEPEQTERELDFLRRQLPQSRYRRLLDICCGSGRLSLPLAHEGFSVTGLDRDQRMITEARAEAVEEQRALFVLGDMRDLSQVEGRFDAAMIMWASFGYFDDDANAAVLAEVGAKLEPHGRLVLDVYHKGYFLKHQGSESALRGGREIVTSREMTGDRLNVCIQYRDTGSAEVMDWRLYTPHELGAMAEELGYGVALTCSNFDESLRASDDNPRMQLVLTRAS